MAIERRSVVVLQVIKIAGLNRKQAFIWTDNHSKEDKYESNMLAVVQIGGGIPGFKRRNIASSAIILMVLVRSKHLTEST